MLTLMQNCKESVRHNIVDLYLKCNVSNLTYNIIYNVFLHVHKFGIHIVNATKNFIEKNKYNLCNTYQDSNL